MEIKERFEAGEVLQVVMDFAACKAPATQRAYHQTLKTLARYLSVKVESYAFERALVTIRPITAQAFALWLKQQRARDGTAFADNTVAHRLDILRRVFRHLIDCGIRERNPFAMARESLPQRRRTQKRPTKLIPYEAVSKILEAPEKRGKEGIRDRALLALLFGGGLRRNEVIKLNVGDVSYTADGVPFLTLRGTKAGTDQQQSLPNWAWSKVLALMDQRDRDGATAKSPLFCFYYVDGRSGGRLSDSSLKRAYKRYCEAAGIFNAAPHSARATAATMLKELGYEDRDVADFLRHSTEQMVRVYDKRSRGPGRNVGRKLRYQSIAELDGEETLI